MFAVFGLMERIGYSSDRRGGFPGYLSLFFATLALYVFFDNSLSLLVFDQRVAAKINTIGVGFCATGLYFSYLGFITSILGMSARRTAWRRLSIVLVLAAQSGTFLVLLHGWEWYMENVDRYLVSLYGCVFIMVIVVQARYLYRRRDRPEKAAVILLTAINVMILSLFFWRYVITVNRENFILNNSISVFIISLFYPFLLRVYRSADFRELMRLRGEIEARARMQNRSLGELFRSAGSALPSSELEVCEALVRGLEYKEISLETGLSLSGVKKRIHSLYGKLGVQNRTELYNIVATLRGSVSSQGEACPADGESVTAEGQGIED